MNTLRGITWHQSFPTSEYLRELFEMPEPEFRKMVLNEWVEEDELPDDVLEAHEILQKRVKGRSA